MKTKYIWLASSILALSVLSCQVTGLVSLATPQAPVVPTQAVKQPTLPSVLQNSGVTQQQDLLVALYEHAIPGIVALRVVTSEGGGQGSGLVYDADGHIVTNYHVVTGATKVEVDFSSGYKTYGTVIGIDLDSDLAVIKVDAPAEELHPLTLGDSDQLKVGQMVIAIGNPFGLSGTMTTGIISSLGRTLASARNTLSGYPFTAGDIIQTDAALNPGNSGGPLFNLNGEVIGINRAIQTTNYTLTGEPVNSGIGFAISINIIKRVVPVLIKEGKYDYPYLGITCLDDRYFSLDVIEALGLKSYTGAYVMNVVLGGPADQAGLRAGNRPTSIADPRIEDLQAGGDLITAIDGQAVYRFDDLLRYLINNKSPGDTVTLTVLRGDQQLDLIITLDKRP